MPAFVELQSLSNPVPVEVTPGSGGGTDIQSGWLTNPAGGALAPAVPGAVTDFRGASATVQSTQGGAAWDYAEVVSVTRSRGVMPGKAVIAVRNLAAADEIGPITLGNNAFAPKQLKYWSRINITFNGVTIFTGGLMKRRESIGGNMIVLEYWDDRWLLTGIRMRGAVCYDPYDQTIKLIPRLDPHVNPRGYKNCTRIPSTNGISSNAFVFLAPAEYGTQTLEYDGTTGGEDGPAGTAIDWTPERWLIYCQYISTIFDATAGNTNAYANTWPQLDTSKLGWPPPTFQDGTMRGKLPDINFKGMTMLKAIDRCLDAAGEYDLSVDYAANYLKFVITTQGVQNSSDSNTDQRTRGKSLFIQRSGAAADIKTIVDGTAETDASELSTGSLVEGAPFKIESEFQYSKTQLAHDSLGLPYTDTDATNFLKIISTGKDLTGTDIPGGSGGSLKNTRQALQVARQSFPKPFRCLQPDPSVSDGLDRIMQGWNSITSKYPYLKTYRVCSPEQLQPYFEDIALPTRRGRLRIPVRIQVSDVDVDTGGAKFHDVPYNNGLRITQDGLIWLDGLTDDTGSSLDWIYTNTLIGYNGTAGTLPKMRYVKINMAVEHDGRILASYDLFIDGIDYNGIADEVDPTLKGTKGPRLQNYVLSPQGFIHEHQLFSNPALPGSFQTSDGGSPPKLTTLTTPCNKILYNNTLNIFSHAARAHQRACRFKRTSSFTMPGIRIDLDAGDYIADVTLVGANGDKLKINAPLDTVKFDFRKQETEWAAS